MSDTLVGAVPMGSVPIRLAHLTALPHGRSSARRMVVTAKNGTLQASDTAFEILSFAAGVTLTPTQRAHLFSTLSEVVTGDGTTVGLGPLSQADVLGEIIGLIHFAVRKPGHWWFAHLPREQGPTPDVIAVPAVGAPWVIELKAVAPLSTEFAGGAVIDVCGNRIHAQRNEGAAQLRARPDLGPGGAALAVSVIPDGSLLCRHDLQAARKRGCPSGPKACHEFCLRPPTELGSSAVVGLLWTAPRVPPSTPSNAGPPAQPDTSGTARALAVAIHCATAAAWARSSRCGDAALDALSRVLGYGETAHEVASDVAMRVLRATRAVTSIDARRRLVDSLGSTAGRAESSELRAEVDRGLARAGEVKTVARGARMSLGHRGEIVFEGAPEFAGHFDGAALTLAPTFSWMIQRIAQANDGMPVLDGAATALSQVVVPAVLGDSMRKHVLPDIEVQVPDSGDAQLVVGRGWGPAAAPFAPWSGDLRLSWSVAWLDAVASGSRQPIRDWLRRHGRDLQILGDAGADEWLHFVAFLPPFWPPGMPGTFWGNGAPVGIWAAADGRLKIGA